MKNNKELSDSPLNTENGRDNKLQSIVTEAIKTTNIINDQVNHIFVNEQIRVMLDQLTRATLRRNYTNRECLHYLNSYFIAVKDLDFNLYTSDEKTISQTQIDLIASLSRLRLLLLRAQLEGTEEGGLKMGNIVASRIEGALPKIGKLIEATLNSELVIYHVMRIFGELCRSVNPRELMKELSSLCGLGIQSREYLGVEQWILSLQKELIPFKNEESIRYNFEKEVLVFGKGESKKVSIPFPSSKYFEVLPDLIDELISDMLSEASLNEEDK